MNEEQLSKLKGIVAMLEYMASAEKMDIRYTQDALGMMAGELYKIIEEVKKQKHASCQIDDWHLVSEENYTYIK